MFFPKTTLITVRSHQFQPNSGSTARLPNKNSKQKTVTVINKLAVPFRGFPDFSVLSIRMDNVESICRICLTGSAGDIDRLLIDIFPRDEVS